jgi:hypothetical protein
LLQLFDDGEIGIEHVQQLLREVAHIQAGAEPHASASGTLAPAIGERGGRDGRHLEDDFALLR